MMMHKITPTVDNLVVERLGTKLNELTNQNSKEVPKVVKRTIKKTLL